MLHASSEGSGSANLRIAECTCSSEVRWLRIAGGGNFYSGSGSATAGPKLASFLTGGVAAGIARQRDDFAAGRAGFSGPGNSTPSTPGRARRHSVGPAVGQMVITRKLRRSIRPA